MLKSLNLALRFIMELAALGALGYWGADLTAAPAFRWLLGLGIPLLAALFWGSFVSPKARFGGPRGRRLQLGLVVLFPAAFAIGRSVSGPAGWAFGAFALLNSWLTFRFGPQPGETPGD